MGVPYVLRLEISIYVQFSMVKFVEICESVFVVQCGWIAWVQEIEPRACFSFGLDSGGGRIRTCDLVVMSHTRYRASPRRVATGCVSCEILYCITCCGLVGRCLGNIDPFPCACVY